jgi:L-fuculose-phosphate aldolase
LKVGKEKRVEPSSLQAEAREVLAAARAISAENLVVGSVGNVSRRVGDIVIVTPTRIGYPQMTVDDLVLVSMSGEPLLSGQSPSQELPLHLAVYRRRQDVGAVIHTHSPHATAWSFLAEPLLPQTEENAYYEIGTVQTSSPAPPGSKELAANAAEGLADSAALLLGDHGVLAAGPTVENALDIARVVERQAQIAWLLRTRLV